MSALETLGWGTPWRGFQADVLVASLGRGA